MMRAKGNSNSHRILLGLAVVVLAASGCSSSSGSGVAHSTTGAASKTSQSEIVLSDAWVGNSWRAEALQDWTSAANQAIGQGLLKSAPEVVANNSLSQQASQLQSLILKHPAAIAIDAASPTALNGAIAQACAAGIIVVAYDSTVTAPCAYKLVNNFVEFGEIAAKYIAQRLHGTGNLLEVRGIAGLQIDNQIHQGWTEVLKNYPGIKVVGSVYGQSVESTAQSAVSSVLPSLSSVQAVLGEGGDAVGIYNAFKSAGRAIPIISMGSSQPELTLWQTLSRTGFQTIGVETIPGESTAALWLALYLVEGHNAPKTIPMPFLVINQNSMESWLKSTPNGGYASVPFGRDYVISLVRAAATGNPAPAIPAP